MKLLVATLFLSGVLSAPFNNVLTAPKPTKCNTETSRFHPSKTLLYKYEGDTISGLIGTSEARTGLKLVAKCEIIPVLPCIYKLKITNAELLESQGMDKQSLKYKTSSGSAELSKQLQARDLYFENEDGMIKDLRPDKEEPTYILNMKRGILSAFQLKMTIEDSTVKEVDVSGECDAKYLVEKRYESGKVKSLLKTKNLGECKDRSTTNLGFPTTSYPTNKSFRLLESKSSCRFLVSELARFGKIHCKETHLFRPFSSGYNKSAGAMTTVRQTLTLLGHIDAVIKEKYFPETEKVSLKYEHSQKEQEMTRSSEEVKQILKDLVSENGVKPDSARLFSKLIFSLRRLNMRALKVIWYEYYECLTTQQCTKKESEKYQTFIVDALSQCGTLECAQYMVRMISEKKVGTQQAISFLTGIALVGKPSQDMVGNILYFCQETPSRTAFLTLGTLMHKFCSQHDCTKLKPRSSIYQADQFLLRNLKDGCKASNSEDATSITLALKAIGNAGRPFTAVKNILKCIVQPGSTAINVEAVQALRRIPCTTNMTEGLLEIFQKLLTDTEVRIETYLALMRCPSNTIINKIADVLDNEKNNQVGSFVWSHITNALESTEPVYGIPLRNLISKALGKRTLRVYKKNHLRYSHAYETSYYNGQNDIGGSGQGQVIFHPNSYFPRSTKFNLTVDVFGASINLVETAARFEGFETLIEQMFGVDGYFPDKRVMELLNKQKESQRSPRSAHDNEIDEIKVNLEKLHDKIKTERKNPSGGMSLKIFGHELQFISFDDINWLQNEADSINFIDGLINLARGGEMTYTKSFMFLEADHEIPTALGLPLRLAVNGSLISSVNLKGKFDIRNMFWGKKGLDIGGVIKPSAVVDISGKMSVDAKHALSGLHLNTTLYTATEINGNATFKEGEGIKLSVEPPSKPVYIVNTTTNLATLLNQKRQRIVGSGPRVERQTCANFSRILGVKLCGHASFPLSFRDYEAPYFPLSGETSFGLVYQTTNAKLARFELQGRTLTNSRDPNRYDWVFGLHVPGLTFGRQIDANSTFRFLEDGKYLSISCGIHDYKFGKFEATYNNVTNGFHTKFSTPQMSYLKPITIESELFNQTSRKSNRKDVGISFNITYNNFTLQEVFSVFKHEDQYGFKSNMTYLPQKHFTTEARVSFLRRSAYINIQETSSKSKFFFVGKSGRSTNKFYIKVGNDRLNYEAKMDGSFNMDQLVMDVATKPSNNLMKFEAYPRSSATEKGFYVSLLNVNTTSKFTGHLRGVNTPNQKALKLSGVAFNKPFYAHLARNKDTNVRKIEFVASGYENTANASLEYTRKEDGVGIEYFAALNDLTLRSKLDLFKDPTKIGFNVNTSVLKKTFNVLGEYFKKEKSNGLHLALSEGDKTLDSVLSYTSENKDKKVELTVNGLGHKVNLATTYYNEKEETGLKWKGEVDDNSMEVDAGFFRNDAEKGLRVKANVLNKEMETRLSMTQENKMRFIMNIMKKTLEVETYLINNDELKQWQTDVVYNNKRTTFQTSFTTRSDLKALCFEVTHIGLRSFQICSKYRTVEVETSVHLTTEIYQEKRELVFYRAPANAQRYFHGGVRYLFNSNTMTDVAMGLYTNPNYAIGFTGEVSGRSVDLMVKLNKSPSSTDVELYVQGRLVSFKTFLFRESSLKGIQLNIEYENKNIGSLYSLMTRNDKTNAVKIGAKLGDEHGIEYKLSSSSTKLEKTIASLLTLTVSKKTYTYGSSLSYSNKTTSTATDYLLTTKLHYSKDKVLTSILHFVNNDVHSKLLSKTEVVPGQFLTNKWSYHKQINRMTVVHDILPGVGLKNDFTVRNTDRLISVISNLTIFDMPMNFESVLYKKSNNLSMKFFYWPGYAPIELTSHLRLQNGIDTKTVLSAFGKTWSETLLLDYSKKQMKYIFDIIPEIPVTIFGEIKDNNKLFLDISPCSAFSLQLEASKLSGDNFQFLINHKYLEKVFEDLRVDFHSVRNLRNLGVNIETKSINEVLKTMNISKEYLLEITSSKLKDLYTLAKERIQFYKQQLKSLKTDDILMKIKHRVLEKTQKMKKCMSDCAEMMLKTLKELERTLGKDIYLWAERSIVRYRKLNICGSTLGQLSDQVAHKVYVDNMIGLYQKVIQTIFDIEEIAKKVEELVKKVQDVSYNARMKIEKFTCNYDMKCTIDNIIYGMEALRDQLDTKELEKLKKTMSDYYDNLEKAIMDTIEDKMLKEKLTKLVEPLVEFLGTVKRLAVSQMLEIRNKIEEFMEKSTYYQKMTFRIKEVVKGYGVFVSRVKEVLKTNREFVMSKIEENKHYWESMKKKGEEMYNRYLSNIEDMRKTSPEELQLLLRSMIEVNYEKLKNNVDILFEKLQQRYIKEIDEVKRIGKDFYQLSEDIVNGQITTLKQLEERVMKIIEDIRTTFAVDKHIEILRTKISKSYNEMRTKALLPYSRMTSEAKRLKEQYKIMITTYMEKANLKLEDLKINQRQHFDSAIVKLKKTRDMLASKLVKIMEQLMNYMVEHRENMFREGKKMFVNYKTMTQDALMTKYNTIRQDIMDVINFYIDMPIENIMVDLRTRLGNEVDKMLGYTIGRALSICKIINTDKIKLKDIYYSGMKEMENTMKMVRQIADKMYEKMKDKYYDIESMYIGKMGDKVMTVLEEKYKKMKSSYDKIKYMKFKEFYMKAKELLGEMLAKIRTRFNELEVEELQTKILTFVEATKTETKKVATRLHTINAEVWEDAVKTFEPYGAQLKDKLAAKKELLNEKIVGLFADNKKMLEVLKKFESSVENLPEEAMKSLKRCPFFIKVFETVEIIKGGRLNAIVMDSINKCPFLTSIRTHKLWPELKTELENHEILSVLQYIRSSLEEMQNQLAESYTRSRMHVTSLKESVMIQHEMSKKQLKINMDKAYEHVKDRGIEQIKGARMHYTLKMKSLEEMIKESLYNLGETSLYDIELEALKYYKTMSERINKVEEYLRKKIREHEVTLVDRFDNVKEKFYVLVTDVKQRCKDVCRSAKLFGKETLEKTKNETKVIREMIKGILITYKNETVQHPLYKNVSKMTPRQILIKVKSITYKENLNSYKKYLVVRSQIFYHSAKVFLRNRAKNFEKNMKIFAIEILETSKFLTTFYGGETVYSRHPELVELAQKYYHLCLSAASKIQLTDVKPYIRIEVDQINIESLEKLVNSSIVYLEKRFPVISQRVRKLNKEAFEMYEKLFKRLSKKGKEYEERFWDLMKWSEDICIIVQSASAKTTQEWLKITNNDITKLVDKISMDLQVTKKRIHGRVLQMYNKSIDNFVEQVEKDGRYLIETFMRNRKLHLPKVQREFETLVQLLKTANMWKIYDAIEPVQDSLTKLFSLVKEGFSLQYTDCRPLVENMLTNMKPVLRKISEQDMLETKVLLELCIEDVRYGLQRIEKHLERFYDTTMKVPRERFMKLYEHVERMSTEHFELCRKEVIYYYEEAKQLVKYIREMDMKETMEEYRNMIINNVESFYDETITNMVERIKSEIETIRKKAMEVVPAVRQNLDNVTQRMSEMIDFDQMTNKTMYLLKEYDIVNDILEFVDSISKQNTQFATYILKHVYRYSYIWDIINELMNPFHWIPPSNSVAMIFGRPHVYTFDGQYYEFPGYKKPSCTYVLAKDTRDNSFTLLSQETALIIITKSGRVKVDASGKVQSSVLQNAEGKKVDIEHDELPVEMKDLNVTREGNYVKIQHNIGLNIVCDLKHFYCTFNIDKLYHGRLAGLLGSNNNEQFDGLMKPDKTLAKSSIEFANAWEVSGDRVCQIRHVKEVKSSCNKKPSAKCQAIFKNVTSPLAKHFKSLDPEPFYKACLFDTSDCKVKSLKTDDVCNVTAAYTALLRERGILATQIEECSSCKANSVWLQKTDNNVDVVLLLPESRDMLPHALNVPRLLREVDHDIRKKYTPRYALVAFGSKHGLHRRPHVVTGNGKIFGNIHNVMKAVKHVKFNHEKPGDAYDTVEYIARLPFKPGSTKIVIFLTDKPRNATRYNKMTSALQHLKMQGIIFNVIGPFYNRQLPTENLLTTTIANDAMPYQSYQDLATSSLGEVFNLKTLSKEGSMGVKLLKKLMKTKVLKQIEDDKSYCRTCVCLGHLASGPEFMCSIDRNRRCS